MGIIQMQLFSRRLVAALLWCNLLSYLPSLYTHSGDDEGGEFHSKKEAHIPNRMALQ